MRRITAFIATIAVFGAFAAPTGAATKSVNWTYSPSSLSIAKGTKVTWVWSGTGNHNVVGSGFSSGSAKGSGSYSRTFSSKGTFSVYCSVHRAAMTQRITVR